MKNAQNIKVGQLGEDIAAKYLKNKDYRIIERNFRKKWGEIDIICEKNGMTHFVEVKSVSQITSGSNIYGDTHRPEDNLHRNKTKRLRRVIETYMEVNQIDGDFVVDLITVKIDDIRFTAHVAIYKEIII